MRRERAQRARRGEAKLRARAIGLRATGGGEFGRRSKLDGDGEEKEKKGTAASTTLYRRGRGMSKFQQLQDVADAKQLAATRRK
jgi:hypothetical protein